MISFNPIRQLPQLNKTFIFGFSLKVISGRVADCFELSQWSPSSSSVSNPFVLVRRCGKCSSLRAHWFGGVRSAKLTATRGKVKFDTHSLFLFVSHVLQFTFFEARCDGNLNVDQHELIRVLIFLHKSIRATEELARPLKVSSFVIQISDLRLIRLPASDTISHSEKRFTHLISWVGFKHICECCAK